MECLQCRYPPSAGVEVRKCVRERGRGREGGDVQTMDCPKATAPIHLSLFAVVLAAGIPADCRYTFNAGVKIRKVFAFSVVLRKGLGDRAKLKG
jgi:hypothetical protein